MQHPGNGNFKIHCEGDWARAQRNNSVAKKTFNIEYDTSGNTLIVTAYSMLEQNFQDSRNNCCSLSKSL